MTIRNYVHVVCGCAKCGKTRHLFMSHEAAINWQLAHREEGK